MSGMDELIVFLRRCLDDDERTARAVRSGPWRTITIPDRSGPDTVLELGGPEDRVVSTGFFEDDPLRPAEAEHIARWDPARVLAEVDAKRRLLAAHNHPHDCIALTGRGDHSVVDGQPWELWELENTEDHGPCFVVRLLAQPYAGRDGWREEWRLDGG